MLLKYLKTLMYRYIPRNMRLTMDEILMHPSHLNVGARSKSVFDGDTTADFDFTADPNEDVFVAYQKDKTILPQVRMLTGYENENSDGVFGSIGGNRITYSFSSAIRNNVFDVKNKTPFDEALGRTTGTYGSSGLSFRMLYEKLCSQFNSGQYFIDVYFDKLFRYRHVYSQYEDLKNIISDSIERDVNEADSRDVYGRFVSKTQAKSIAMIRRVNVKKFKWKSMKSFRDASIRSTTRRIANAIRNDIIQCLSTGELSNYLFKKRVEDSTIMERESFGFSVDPEVVFYASGQLIRNLQIYIKVLGLQ